MEALLPGSELDYCLGGSLWVPARVESTSTPQEVTLRFTLGWGLELTHTLSTLLATRLVSPAGTYTLPLLSGQPLDFLYRVPGTSSFPASEQWLSGELRETNKWSGPSSTICLSLSPK